MQNVHFRLACVSLYSLPTFPHPMYVQIQEENSSSSIFKHSEHQLMAYESTIEITAFEMFWANACFVVQVLFEMKNQGITPNAVTYGYYNRVSTLCCYNIRFKRFKDENSFKELCFQCSKYSLYFPSKRRSRSVPFPLNRGVASIEVTDTKCKWTFFQDQNLCPLNGGVPLIEVSHQ